MNRRFNMLPARYAERMAERRLAGITAAALVTLLVLLALAGLNQRRVLGQAQDRRDTEQARTNVLTARRAQLVRFRRLADAIVARERLLTAAMGTEISWATVLASLAQAFPADASLTSVNLQTRLPPFGAPPLRPGDEQLVVGSSALKGYSLTAFTPGVERLLQLLTHVTGLSEPRMQVGTREELGRQPVTTFDGSAFVDAAALTGRYAKGLPPEADVEVPAVGTGTPPAQAGTSK